VCGTDYCLYATPLIKFQKACYQLVAGNAWYLAGEGVHLVRACVLLACYAMSLPGTLQGVTQALAVACFTCHSLPRPTLRYLLPALPLRACLPAVRVGYPCFGNPTKNAQGKIVGYPAYGRWRVHNLYVSIWQKVPSSHGRVKPYDVLEVYRY
jgi:hypothetical protein